GHSFKFMTKRDEKITKHIGRYRVSTRAVISHLFFADKNCDHVVQRLLDVNRIRAFAGLPGGLSYYQLTISEARRLGLPPHRANPHHAAGLREALAVLWFCCMAGEKRKRLERTGIKKLFGRGKGFGKPHCAEERGGERVVYRIFAPGPNSRLDYRVRTLRDECRVVLEHPKLAQWALAGVFRFAVLVETPGRLEKVKTLLKHSGPWPVQIHVELVPSAGELAGKI